MPSCSSVEAATSFQNFTTRAPGRGNRVSFIHGVEFWNPPPELQSGVLRSQALVAGCTDRNVPSLFFIRRNPQLPLASSSSSKSKVELEIASEDEIQALDEEDSPTVHIKLQLRRECQFGQQFFVTGDHPALGLWDPMNAAPMVWSDGHVWTSELDLPSGMLIQFKFILRDFSGEILWQPGPNRVLQTRESSEKIVVVGDWEKVPAPQVTEQHKGDIHQYEVSDELMIHEKKQLTNDAARSDNLKGEPHLECSNGDIASLNDQAMFMVADNISYHALQEGGHLSKNQAEGNVEFSSIEVVAQRFNSHAAKEEVATTNKSLEKSKDILETEQEIPILVPGLTYYLITPTEDATAVEEEVELDMFDNARNPIAESSDPECLHRNGQNQIQLDLKEEAIEGYQENEEEEEVQEEVITEYPNKLGFLNGHEPVQPLQLTYFGGQDNRNSSILHNHFKWGQETLRRFLDKLGFGLQL